MRHTVLFFVHLSCLLTFSRLTAQQPNEDKPAVLPPQVQQLKDKLMSNTKTQITEPYEKAVAALNTQYIGAIDRMVANPPKLMNAAEILALQTERDELVRRGKVPRQDLDGTSRMVRELRLTYRKGLHAHETNAESQWIALRNGYLNEVSNLYLNLLKTNPQEALTMLPYSAISRDIDFVASEGKQQLAGTWKIYQSDGQEDTWTFTKTIVKVHLNLITSNSDGWADAASNFYRVRIKSVNHEWLINMHGQLMFEGKIAKPLDGKTLTVLGERPRPWRDSL